MDTRIFLFGVVGLLLVTLGGSVSETNSCKETVDETLLCVNVPQSCGPGFFKKPVDACPDTTSTETTSTSASTTDSYNTSNSDSLLNETTTVEAATTTTTTTSPLSSTDLDFNTTDTPDNTSTTATTTSEASTTETPQLYVCVKCSDGCHFNNRSNTCVANSHNGGVPVWYIALGSAAGFVVVLIVVVVVVVVCCRSRKKKTVNKHTRMSAIIINRDATDLEAVGAESSESPKSRDKNPYVNTAYVEGLSTGIERQHCKITRYTKDPTFKPQTDDKHPDYENKAALEWNQPHREKDEIAKLPVAPPPPRSDPSRPSSSSPTATTQATAEEEYVPMDQNVTEIPDVGAACAPEEDYENFRVSAEGVESEEIYENADIERRMTAKTAGTSGGVCEKEKEDEEEEEDYENTKDFQQHRVTKSQVSNQNSTGGAADDEGAYANFPFFNK